MGYNKKMTMGYNAKFQWDIIQKITMGYNVRNIIPWMARREVLAVLKANKKEP